MWFIEQSYDVFHVSLFKKYHPDPTHVLSPEDIELDESLTYKERPIQVLDRKVKDLRNKQISLVKILQRHHEVEEATWELKKGMREKYPELFANKDMNFEVEILLRGRECEDSQNSSYFLENFLYFE